MLLGQAPDKIKCQFSQEFITMKYPTTWKNVKYPLLYDISGSFKRMVQFMYLRINIRESKTEKDR